MLEQTAGKSRRPVVFGAGTNPIGWVDVHEVAALVEHAVLEPALRGRVLGIPGPERLTLDLLPQVDDRETRAAFPDLPAVPVSRLLAQTAQPA